MNKSKRFKAPHSSIKIDSKSTEDQLIFGTTVMGKTLNPTAQVDIDRETFSQLTSLIDARYLGQSNTTLAVQWLNQVAEKLGLIKEGDRDEN